MTKHTQDGVCIPEYEFELRLANGRTVSWIGTDGVDAARRYANAHPGAIVIAWRHPKNEIRIGSPRSAHAGKLY